METTAPPATVPEAVVGPGMAPSKPMVDRAGGRVAVLDLVDEEEVHRVARLGEGEELAVVAAGDRPPPPSRRW